jgi:hypothetical protein
MDASGKKMRTGRVKSSKRALSISPSILASPIVGDHEVPSFPPSVSFVSPSGLMANHVSACSGVASSGNV